MKLAIVAVTVTLTASAQYRPVTAAGRITDTGFAGNLAASVQGTLPFRPVRFPQFMLFGGGYGVYGYPGWVDPSAYAQPLMIHPPMVVMQPEPSYPAALAAEPASSKADGNPVRIYSNPVAMAPPDVPTQPSGGDQVVILALKNGGVETAIAYWTDGDELKYITPDRKQREVALANVDTALSTRLNRERGVPFSLAKVE